MNIEEVSNSAGSKKELPSLLSQRQSGNNDDLISPIESPSLPDADSGLNSIREG